MTYFDHGAFKLDTLTEWAKLLVILERHIDEEWLIPRAVRAYLTMLLKWAGMKK